MGTVLLQAVPDEIVARLVRRALWAGRLASLCWEIASLSNLTGYRIGLSVRATRLLGSSGAGERRMGRRELGTVGSEVELREMLLECAELRRYVIDTHAGHGVIRSDPRKCWAL
jgi:hypothetical protein